jgi:hypothetical protein
MEKEGFSYALIAIVAIVAIVALIIGVIGNKASVSVPVASSEDLTGEAGYGLCTGNCPRGSYLIYSSCRPSGAGCTGAVFCRTNSTNFTEGWCSKTGGTSSQEYGLAGQAGQVYSSIGGGGGSSYTSYNIANKCYWKTEERLYNDPMGNWMSLECDATADELITGSCGSPGCIWMEVKQKYVTSNSGGQEVWTCAFQNYECSADTPIQVSILCCSP